MIVTTLCSCAIYRSQDLNFILKSFNGRSDYGPFIEEGIDIPGMSGRGGEGRGGEGRGGEGRGGEGRGGEGRGGAGGLATGADETKSDMDRKDYGGLANAILDPCYHQVCAH